MSNFTFLTEEQYFGSDKLDIFTLWKRGTKAAITDFSILLGARVSDYDHVNGDTSLEGRTGMYWTKSDDGPNDARMVNFHGRSKFNSVLMRNVGARPALPFSSISSIPTNGESGKRARKGVLEVEYGYYPQKAESKEMQDILERAYKSGRLTKTGNSYTTDSRNYHNYFRLFKAKTHEEYEFNGKRYVRVEANSSYDGSKFTLSNGEEYKDGDNVWVEVLPVKWLVDKKFRMMITEKLIFSGVQFNCTRDYHTKDFDKTDIKKFMDDYFARDLVQSRGIGQQSQTRATNKTTKNENPYNLQFRGDEVR